MFRTSLFAAVLAGLFAAVPVAHAADFDGETDAAEFAAPTTEQVVAQERLMIVNRNTGRVIYDDGRNDLFCSTRLYVAGYTYYGRPIYRRNMHCR